MVAFFLLYFFSIIKKLVESKRFDNYIFSITHLKFKIAFQI